MGGGNLFNSSVCILVIHSMICLALLFISEKDILEFGYLIFAGGELSLMGLPSAKFQYGVDEDAVL